MSIAQAEVLKHDLTDKYVVVAEGVPELRRFAGLTGQVKTVNMNGRALVQFDGPVDIGWYDIDPSFLKVVDAPRPKAKGHEKPAEAPAKAEKPKPAAAGGEKKLSPLELARQQGAAGKTGAAPAPPAAEGKKLSPLELARQQGAAGKTATQPAASSPPAGEKKLSPLELARQQGAAKSSGSPGGAPADVTIATPAEEPPVPEEQAVVEQPAPASTAPPAAKPGSTAEILALARQQGAFKG